MKEIYADCASTTPISELALRVMTECMRTCYGNPSSSHHCGREAARVLEEARDGIAACIGADREEIYFTSGGTEADNQAIFTAAAYGKAMGKHHMIFSSIEHHAVLNCIPALKKAGFEITQIGVDPWGRVSMEELKAACNTHSVEPSHVLTAMGLTKERAGSCIRISFSADHTEEDIDQICSILKQEVARARQ